MELYIYANSIAKGTTEPGVKCPHQSKCFKSYLSQVPFWVKNIAFSQSIWNFGLFGQSCLFSSTNIRTFTGLNNTLVYQYGQIWCMSPGRTITQGACQQNWRVLVEGANVQISMFFKRAINIGFQSKGLKMNQKMSVFFPKRAWQRRYCAVVNCTTRIGPQPFWT